jgi:biopolymer transport protein ExbD
MSAVNLPGSGDDDNNQDFDLNIVPIIDAFTVLIAYLLASASFISLGIFDVDIATSGPGAAVKPPKPALVRLSIDVKSNGSVLVKLSGAQNENVTMNLTENGKWSNEPLKAKLKAIKEKFSTLEDATVTGENKTPYKDVVGAIEAVKDTFPNVTIGDS